MSKLHFYFTHSHRIGDDMSTPVVVVACNARVRTMDATTQNIREVTCMNCARYMHRTQPRTRKLCPKCNEMKEACDFSRKRSGSQLSSWCKGCTSDNLRKWHAARKMYRSGATIT